MQPCSQPRYGLIDCSKWMSGESLRLMIERARSSVTTVSGRGAISSSRYQPSSSRVFATDSKRPSGFEAAPRPLMRAGASMRCSAEGSAESRFMADAASMRPLCLTGCDHMDLADRFDFARWAEAHPIGYADPDNVPCLPRSRGSLLNIALAK